VMGRQAWAGATALERGTWAQARETQGWVIVQGTWEEGRGSPQGCTQSKQVGFG